MDKKKNRIAVGQINLAKSQVVKLQDGSPEGSLFKRSLIVFEGEFVGMNGPIKVSPELLELMVNRFNREFENPKNEHDYPPLLVDHNPSADLIKGRLLPPLVIEDWVNPRNNETIKAMFGDIRVDEEEAKEKVIKGQYSHLSISFDDDIDNLGEIFELSFVAVEAARGAQVLKQGEKSMDELAKLTAKLSKSNASLTSMRAKKGESRLVRSAAYQSLSMNLEQCSKDAKEIISSLGKTVESLKKNALKSQFTNYVKEGRLSKAEFDKIDLDDVAKMSSGSQKIYLTSFANRPVSPDLFQHGMNGAEPLDSKGMKLSSTELRRAMKAQTAGEEYTPKGVKLLTSDDERKDENGNPVKAAGDNGDNDDDKETALTMDDIEDALSKLEGLVGLADKLSEASSRMSDTLSKLQGDDEKEKEKDDKEEGA